MNVTMQVRPWLTMGVAALFGAAIFAQTPQGAPAAGAQGQAQGQGQARGGRGPQTPPLLMTTTAFEDGGIIPEKYTQASAAGAVSPALKWTQVPPGTQSLTLIVHDLESVQMRGAKIDNTHWMMWNIPATSAGLPENVPVGETTDGSRQLSTRSAGYMGPGAPAGPYHHYVFELYALDIKLDVPTGTPQQTAETRLAVLNAMEGHVIGKAALVGRFRR